MQPSCIASCTISSGTRSNIRPRAVEFLSDVEAAGRTCASKFMIPVLAYGPIICRKSSMRFTAWIRLNRMAWVSDCSWFDGQRICSAIASGSDPQSGTDHVFRSWPEQDREQIGLPRLSKSRSTIGLRRCSPVQKREAGPGSYVAGLRRVGAPPLLVPHGWSKQDVCHFTKKRIQCIQSRRFDYSAWLHSASRKTAQLHCS
jgi:hypothetical protein